MLVVGSIQANMGLHTAAFSQGVSAVKAQAASLRAYMRSQFAAMRAEIGGHLRSLSSNLLELGLSAGAVFLSLRKALGSAQEEQEGINRLATSVRRAGGDWAKMEGPIENAVASMQRFTKYGDGETRETLSRMITYSRDVAGSIANVELALDLASGAQKDHASAGRLMGLALRGNIEALRRELPEVKALTNGQLDNMNAHDRAAFAVRALARQFGGAARGEAQGWVGQMYRIKNGVGDVIENLGHGVAAVLQFHGAINRIADGVDALANSLASHKGLAGGLALGGTAALSLVTTLGLVAKVVPIVTGTISAGWGILSGLAAFLAGPWGIAIAVVIAGIIAVKNNFLGLGTAAKAVWNGILATAKVAWAIIWTVVKFSINGQIGTIVGLWNVAKVVWTEIGDKFGLAWKYVREGAAMSLGPIARALGILGGKAAEAARAIAAAFSTSQQQVRDFADGPDAQSFGLRVVQAFQRGQRDYVGQFVNWAKGQLSDLGNTASEVFGGLGGTGGDEDTPPDSSKKRRDRLKEEISLLAQLADANRLSMSLRSRALDIERDLAERLLNQRLTLAQQADIAGKLKDIREVLRLRVAVVVPENPLAEMGTRVERMFQRDTNRFGTRLAAFIRAQGQEAAERMQQAAVELAARLQQLEAFAQLDAAEKRAAFSNATGLVDEETLRRMRELLPLTNQIGLALADAFGKGKTFASALAETISGVVTTAMYGFMSATESAFEALVDGSMSAGAAFAKGMLGALRDVARAFSQLFIGKAVAEVAEALAHPPAAAQHLAAAAKYGLAATLMAALAGGIGGAANTIGRGGGGGGSGGESYQGNSSAQTASSSNPQVHVHVFVDPFDPDNAKTQAYTLKAYQGGKDRYGDQVPTTTTYHGRGA